MTKSFRRLRREDAMLDLAWTEVMLVGAVALVAIGPKDMPKVMHALGRWAGKARAFVYDFQRLLDQITRDAEGEAKSGKADADRSLR